MLASWASSQSQNGVSLSSFSASWPRRYRASCGSTSDKSCKLIASVVGAPKNHSLFFWFWCPPFFGSNQHPVNIFFTKTKVKKMLLGVCNKCLRFAGVFCIPKMILPKNLHQPQKKGLSACGFSQLLGMIPKRCGKISPEKRRKRFNLKRGALNE